MVQDITNHRADLSPSAILPARYLAAIFLGVALHSTLARAQYQPPPPPLTSAPCVPTRKDPCKPASPPPTSANPFPFPGEAPDAPSASVPTPANSAPTHPFPSGATPDLPPEDPSPSSSSSSSATPAEPPLPSRANADQSEPPRPSSPNPSRFARKRLPKVEDLDHREAEDLDVARYYLSTGNLLAAYNRAHDAVTIMPDDPNAHLVLAESAQRLHKNEEAVAQYRQYLSMEPDGPKAKAARKSLASLAPK